MPPSTLYHVARSSPQDRLTSLHGAPPPRPPTALLPFPTFGSGVRGLPRASTTAITTTTTNDNQLVEALRWRAACLQAAAANTTATTAPPDKEAAGKVAALLASGDALSAWSKSKDSKDQAGGAAAGRELVAQQVAAGVRVSGGRRGGLYTIIANSVGRKRVL